MDDTVTRRLAHHECRQTRKCLQNHLMVIMFGLRHHHALNDAQLCKSFWLDRTVIILLPVHLNLILICEKILEKK